MLSELLLGMEKDAYNVIHDCLVDFNFLYPSFKIKTTDYNIKSIYDNLPNEITNEAISWGWNDTVVKDSIYKFVKKYEGNTNE